MTPLIKQDGPAAREYARTCRQDTDPAVRPGTAPAEAGNEAAVTATSVPPLSGGPGNHGSEAAHALTIADSAGGGLCRNSLAGRRRAGRWEIRLAVRRFFCTTPGCERKIFRGPPAPFQLSRVLVTEK